MLSEETLTKITGDPLDEMGESLYRTVASALVHVAMLQSETIISRLVAVNAIKTKWWPFSAKWWPFGRRRRGRSDRPSDDNAIENFLSDEAKMKLAVEPVISFALAIVCELIPVPKIPDNMRKRLAYNLRVRAYEKAEEIGVRYTPVREWVQSTAEQVLLEEFKKRGLIGARESKPVVEAQSGDSETAKAS